MALPFTRPSTLETRLLGLSAAVRTRLLWPCLAASVLAGCGARAEDVGPESERFGAALSSSGYTATEYPIVLCHGMFGFGRLMGMVDYWFRIVSSLREGGAEVYVTQVTPLASPEARGEVLISQIERIVAISGKQRVNLIGHSQGGLDARYVAAVRPDLVASITTVGSPNGGAELATFLLDHTTPNGFARSVLVTFGNSLGAALALLGGGSTRQDILGAAATMSIAGMARFNERYGAGVPSAHCGEGAPEVGGIRFYSWTGTALRTNFLDAMDPLLAFTSRVYHERSDGLVGRCSAHLGEVIRDDFAMNHLDEVNLLFGLIAPFQVNPVAVFRTHANRLKNAGL